MRDDDDADHNLSDHMQTMGSIEWNSHRKGAWLGSTSVRPLGVLDAEKVK